MTVTQEMLDTAKKRNAKDIKLKEEYEGYLQEMRTRNEEMINDLQTHQSQLSFIEVAQGDFTAHIFGLRNEEAEFDMETKALEFKPGGSVQAAISTNLTSWKDSSQLTIRVNEGGK